MSKQIEDQASAVPADSPPTATTIAFTLVATNASSIKGDAYFSIFPPPLKSPAVTAQVPTALVSAATDAKTSATTTLTWNGGSGALVLLAMAAGDAPANAEKTAVALGDKATVTYANGAYAITAATGGPANAIEVIFDEGVPASSLIGLVVGPAPILLKPPAGMGSLTLEPDMSPTVKAVFGTACTYPPPENSNVDQGLTVTFLAGGGGSTASAQIAVDLDNLIVQTG